MCLRKYIKSLKWKWLISHIPHSLKIEFSWGIANPTWCPWTRLRTWDYWLASPIFLTCPLVLTTMYVYPSFCCIFDIFLGRLHRRRPSLLTSYWEKRLSVYKKGSHHYAWHKSGPTLSSNAESPPLVRYPLKSVNSNFTLAVGSPNLWQAKTHFLFHHNVCCIDIFSNFLTRNQWSS